MPDLVVSRRRRRRSTQGNPNFSLKNASQRCLKGATFLWSLGSSRGTTGPSGLMKILVRSIPGPNGPGWVNYWPFGPPEEHHVGSNAKSADTPADTPKIQSSSPTFAPRGAGKLRTGPLKPDEERRQDLSVTSILEFETEYSPLSTRPRPVPASA